MTRNSKDVKRLAIRFEVTFTLSPVHPVSVMLRAMSQGRLPVASMVRRTGLVSTALRRRSAIRKGHVNGPCLWSCAKTVMHSSRNLA